MTYDIPLSVVSFGKTDMLKATSDQFPNLIVLGTDAADLLECIPPVIISLMEASGQIVQTATMNGTDLTNLSAHIVM